MFYAVDELDAPQQIGLPRMDTGSPAPHIAASEGTLALEYNGFADPDCSIVTVVFNSPRAHYLGFPNEEVSVSHPLYARGLRWYSFFEIANSSWVRAMERANRIHPRHTPELFAALKHYLILFHDSTFECVARGYTHTRRPGELV
jgi:hypothetical protein